MDRRRPQSLRKAKEFTPTTAIEVLTSDTSLHCGSEQLYAPDDVNCPNHDRFPDLKADLYAALSSIVCGVARDAAEQLKTLPLSDEEPIIELARALDDSFGSLYLSVDVTPPEAPACPHYQDVEHVIRPGIHTAVDAIDLLMTTLEHEGRAEQYQKATRLLQRMALLHANSLSLTLNRLRSMIEANDPVTTYHDGSRLEFVEDLDQFISEQEAFAADKTRLGCPIMLDANALRELWGAYGERYVSKVNASSVNKEPTR